MYCKTCKKVSYQCRRELILCTLSKDDKISLSTLKDYCETINSKKLSCGECTILDGHFLGHYICNEKLYFRINNITCLFSDVTFQHSKLFFKNRVLDIIFQNGENIRLKYKIKRVLNFLYEEDEEDIDYGLFLYNMAYEKSNQILIDTYMNYK